MDDFIMEEFLDDKPKLKTPKNEKISKRKRKK